MMRIVLAALLAVAATPAFALELKSTDVSDGARFDQKYVCSKSGGMSISPALTWSGVPTGTKSLAVTMFDPDAGTAGYWHWLVADLPASATSLPQGAGGAGGSLLPVGATPLPNGAGHKNYDGPCPPAGKPHHYQITVYALPDAKAAVTAGMNAPAIGAWLHAHAIESARIVPVYGK